MLGERACFNDDAVAQTEMVYRTSAGRAHYAIPMGIIYHQESVVLICQICHFRQGGKVAVHAEYAVCDDEPFAFDRLLQQLFQIIYLNSHSHNADYCPVRRRNLAIYKDRNPVIRPFYLSLSTLREYSRSLPEVHSTIHFPGPLFPLRGQGH